jgi:glycosyltransferase involved in cell wall biosynthesis
MDPLRIGIVAPTWFPVPPPLYGGIEQVVSLLADHLVDAGHEVTLFASGDSHTRARLVCAYDEAPSERVSQTLPEALHALMAFGRADEFDVLNDHSGIVACALAGLVETPVAHTLHGPLDAESGAIYTRVCQLVPSLSLVSISMSQRAPLPELPWVANCPNAVDLAAYPCHPHRGDYLLFLGRMTADKGCHRAIAVAMEADVPLKIAGKNREPQEREYFDALVRPHLHDRIEYVGEVSHGEKVELLQNARATLFPIEWEEPFGLVMIESMACGTPVIGTRRGAVPEVIEHGRSGIIVDDYRAMPHALEEADAIDPWECRHYVEECFAPERMVADYVEAYRETITRSRSR